MNNENKKKILLVYVAMYTGGIETLIIRMSDWFIQNSYEVDILLLKKEGELLDRINKKVTIFSLNYFSELDFISKLTMGKYPKDYSVIYSFSPLTTWIALLLAKNQINTPVVINGVYHLYDYKLYGDKYLCKVFDKILPDNSKIFMTSQVKVEHERIFNRDITDAIIWPLAINCKIYGNERKPKKFKLVSIGRLSSFKTYNLYMLDIVSKLRKNGYDVEYYIYGTGEMYNSILNRIAKLQLSKYVYLCGTIEYSKMETVLYDAYAFIGMGTAVIEAGLCKVPSIVAIAYSKSPITHGYIHELKNYNSGEFNKDYNIEKVYNKLVSLFKLNDNEYLKICSESNILLKKQYDIDMLMNDFLNIVGKLDKLELKYRQMNIPWFYIIKKTYRKVLIKMVRKIKNILMDKINENIMVL